MREANAIVMMLPGMNSIIPMYSQSLIRSSRKKLARRMFAIIPNGPTTPKTDTLTIVTDTMYMGWERSTRNILAGEKNKAPMLEAAMEEEDDSVVLRKLKPKIPDHNDAHPVAEDMNIRKDSGLRLWRMADPYATRRRTAVDYRFHTKEQQDFYETILLDKKPIVCDMRWVD